VENTPAWYDHRVHAAARVNIRSDVVALLRESGSHSPKCATNGPDEAEAVAQARHIEQFLLRSAGSFTEYTSRDSLAVRVGRVARALEGSSGRDMKKHENSADPAPTLSTEEAKLDIPAAQDPQSSLGDSSGAQDARVGHHQDLPTQEAPKSKRYRVSVRNAQLLLLFLRHAARCDRTGDRECSLGVRCQALKRLWQHAHGCRDPTCTYQHCRATRFVVTHYHRCKDPHCQICFLVRFHVIHSRRRKGPRYSARDGPSALATPPPPLAEPAAPEHKRTPAIGADACVLFGAPRKVVQAQLSMLADPYSGRTPAWIRQRFGPLVVEMMESPSGWMFNRPVDPAKQQLPGYYTVVSSPMDLATVKRRLDRSEYRAIPVLVRDVRLVFENALRYFGPQSEIGGAAQRLLDDFRHKVTNTRDALVKEQVQRRGAEDHCALCGEGELYFESPIFCSGPQCRGKRVRRHSNYYACQRTKELYCTSCHTEVQQQPHHPQREFLRLRHSEREDEPWVQCDSCQRWVHQICALANPVRLEDPNVEYAFVCAVCLDGEDTPSLVATGRPRGEQNRAGDGQHLVATMEDVPPPIGAAIAPSSSPRAVVAEGVPEDATAAAAAVPGTDQPAVLPSGADLVGAVRRASARSEKSGAFSAASLAGSHLSQFLEDQLAADLKAASGQHSGAADDSMAHGEGASAAAIPALRVRLLSNSRRTSVVPPAVRARYPDQDLPVEIPFWSKCIALFQERDGIDLLLFVMYVFEYDDPASGPNFGRVYISYLDSVKYFNPPRLRQRAYQGLVANYLAYAKERGFHTAHIWACPPEKGDDYIFYCHPLDQRIPKEDQLQQWYRTVLARCRQAGTVGQVTGLLEEVNRASVRVGDLPMFEGDYWATELPNAVSVVEAREREQMQAHEADAAELPPRKRPRRSSSGRGRPYTPTRLTGLSPISPATRTTTTMAFVPDASRRDPVLSVLAGGIATGEKNFFVIELHPGQARPDAVAPDPDPPRSSDMFDHRRQFLGFCQKRNFQFDSLRRAKFSSSMVIFSLQCEIGSDFHHEQAAGAGHGGTQTQLS